jgi:hypothetical protein
VLGRDGFTELAAKVRAGELIRAPLMRQLRLDLARTHQRVHWRGGRAAFYVSKVAVRG